MFNYSEFYYHNMKFSLSTDELVYNRAINKMNELQIYIKSFVSDGLKRSQSITMPFQLSKGIYLIVELDSANWSMCVYNAIKKEFECCPVKSFCDDLTNRKMERMGNTMNKLLKAMDRGEVSQHYSPLPERVKSDYDLYKESIPSELNYITILDIEFTDNVKTIDDLQSAISKIDNENAEIYGFDIAN